MRHGTPSWRCLIGVLLLTAAAGAKTGSIRGVVYDDAFDSPLPKATVSIAGTDRKTTTDEEGNYVFHEVKPGSYTLVFSKRGYTREVVSGVVVEPGSLAEVDARLTGDFAELAQFVVRDLQLDPGSKRALLNLRMESPQMLDSISAEVMSRAGAGDAAEALKLVAGTTTANDKAVVRGLPDRYVSSQLNGVRLPSADPKTRSVELDQFPSEVIESIQVSKTFTPDQQGDASGGAVNIITKSIPDKAIFKLESGGAVNTQALDVEDDFLTYRGGGIEGLGLSDNRERNAAPAALNDLMETALGVSRGNAPAEYSMSMTAGGSHDLTDKVRIGGLLSVFQDQSVSFFDNGQDNALWRKTGGQNPRNLIPISSQQAGAPGQNAGGEPPKPGTTKLLDIVQGKEQVQWGGLATFGVELEDHKLGFTFLHSRTVEDIATLAEDTRGKQFFFPGHDPSDPTSPGFTDPRLEQADGDPALEPAGGSNAFPEFLTSEAPYSRFQTIRRVERELQSIQFDGTHTIPVPDWGEKGTLELLDPEVAWTVALNEAQEDEPDKRQFGSLWTPRVPPIDAQGITLPESPAQHQPRRPSTGFSIGNIQRTFETVTETGEQFSGHLKIPFKQWNDRKGYLEIGFFDDSVERTFEQESFQNTFDNETRAQDVTFEAPFEASYAAAFPSLPNANDFEPVNGDIDYKGTFDIRAWYWMLDVPVTDWLKAIGGARFESTDIRVVTDPEKNAEIVDATTGAVETPFGPNGKRRIDEETGLPVGDAAFHQKDVLPSFSLVLTPRDDLTIRGSYAETIARQTFRELAPIQQQEFLGGDKFVGNPNLRASSVENWDLRVDYRPFEGSLVSVSGFLKDIRNPIEVVQRAAGTGTFVFDIPVNFPSGELRGLELVMRQDLKHFADWLRGFSVNFNATFLESDVRLSRNQIDKLSGAFPNRAAPITERDMIETPERLMNANVQYKIEETGTRLGLFYTLQGDKLVAGPGNKGGNFVPARVREEYGTLNFTVSQKLFEHFELSFKAENLTNPEIREVFRSKFTEDALHSTFTKGIDFSVGLSASFEF